MRVVSKIERKGTAMYDVYCKVSDQFERLVVHKGDGLPSAFNPNEWQLLGSPYVAKPDIDMDIKRQGFSKYRTGLNFNEKEILGAMPK